MPGPRQDVVALNAGAALWVGGQAPDMAAGIALAREVLVEGRGIAVRDAWIARSQALAGS